MLLLNVILMPYSMALDDPAPEEEKKGENALEMGAAIAKRYGYNVPNACAQPQYPGCDPACRRRGRRGRNYPGSRCEIEGIRQWGKTSLEIMRRATCEVIVDKCRWKKNQWRRKKPRKNQS